MGVFCRGFVIASIEAHKSFPVLRGETLPSNGRQGKFTNERVPNDGKTNEGDVQQ